MKSTTKGADVRGYTYPKTVAQFKRQGEAGFRRANPDAVAVGLVFEWSTDEFDRPRLVKYPTGHVAYHGVATATAPGFGSQRILVDADRDGLLIRTSPRIDVSGVVRSNRRRVAA